MCFACLVNRASKEQKGRLGSEEHRDHRGPQGIKAQEEDRVVMDPLGQKATQDLRATLPGWNAFPGTQVGWTEMIG